MKRNLFLILVLLVFLMACRDSTNQPTRETVDNATVAEIQTSALTAEEIITIQFAVNDVYINDYDDLIVAFEQEYPNIKIQVKSIEAITAGLEEAEPGETNRRIAQAADVFPGQYAFGPNWRQLTLDLTPFIAADANFNRDDFPSGLLQEGDGSIRVLPQSLNLVLLLYNKDLFDSAGLDYPQPGWTWEEFRAAASALTIRDGDEVAQWGLVHAFPGSLAFYASQLDSWLIEWSQEPPRPRFTDPDVVEAVRQHTDLYLVDQVGPDGRTMEAYNEAESLIAAGRAAMWPAFYDELDVYAVGEQNVGVVPFPGSNRINGQNTTMIYVDGFAISAGTAYPQVAWEWINFLSRQTPIVPGSIPVRTSTREATGFWQDVDPEVQQVVEDALTHSFKYYFSPATRLFGEALTAILTQEKSVTDALAEAQTAAAQALGALAGDAIAEPVIVTDEVETSAGTINITFLPHPLTDELEKYHRLANRFMEEYPDIIITVKRHNFDNFTMNVDEDGTPGDCFQWGLPDLYNPAERTSILSLDAFIETEPDFDLTDFYPALVEPFRYQGQLWALPAAATPVIIQYNKDVFDAAGVAYPQEGWTFADFLDIAVTLTQGEGETKQYGFVPEVIEASTANAMLSRFGVSLVDTSVDPPTAAFTDPVVVEAVRWYADLSRTYGVKPVMLIDYVTAATTNPGPYFDQRNRLVQEGLAGMWTLSSPTNYGLTTKLTQGLTNVGAAPLPLNPGAQSTSVTVTGYFISSDTPHRQACWQWITFLTTVDANPGMPARRTVAESDAYWQRVGAETAAANLGSINQTKRSNPDFYQIRWMGFGNFWLYVALAQIVEGGMTAEEALTIAQETFAAYRSCIIERDAFYDLNARNNCAQEVDPTIPGFMLGGGR